VILKVLSLGISSAVALFQGQMKDLLEEDLIAAGVRVYLDDILIFSKTLLKMDSRFVRFSLS